MEKWIARMVGITLLFSLVACAGSTPATPSLTTDNRESQNPDDSPIDTNMPDSTTAESNSTSDTTEMNTVLVVYFSGSGNTERVAGYIAKKTNGTLFPLVPTEPYTSADLSWTTAGSRVNREHDDESLRDISLVTTTPDHFEEYDTIFIGYPIWWGMAAWPVNTFIKNNDSTGKTVIPFATSASSGIGESGKLLQDMTDTGNWLEGHRFSSGASQSTVESWINELQLDASER